MPNGSAVFVLYKKEEKNPASCLLSDRTSEMILLQQMTESLSPNFTLELHFHKWLSVPTENYVQ